MQHDVSSRNIAVRSPGGGGSGGSLSSERIIGLQHEPRAHLGGEIHPQRIGILQFAQPSSDGLMGLRAGALEKEAVDLEAGRPLQERPPLRLIVVRRGVHVPQQRPLAPEAGWRRGKLFGIPDFIEIIVRKRHGHHQGPLSS